MIKKSLRHTCTHFSPDFSCKVSQPGVECLGDIWKKPVRDRKGEWLIETLEQFTSENNAPRINKPSHLEAGRSLKCWIFQSVFTFQTIRAFFLSSAWEACVSCMRTGTGSFPPYAPLYLLHSVPLCKNAPTEAELLSKRRHAKTTRSLFLLPFL